MPGFPKEGIACRRPSSQQGGREGLIGTEQDFCVWMTRCAFNVPSQAGTTLSVLQTANFKAVAESKHISRVIREVNKHHIHLMAIGEQGNNHSLAASRDEAGSSGSPRRLLHFLEHLQTSACYLQSRAHATHTQCFKTWPREKVERWRLPTVSPGGG